MSYFYASNCMRYSDEPHPVTNTTVPVNSIVRVEAEDEIEARGLLNVHYGNNYAFIYTEDDVRESDFMSLDNISHYITLQGISQAP